jgi:hypothetical protein
MKPVADAFTMHFFRRIDHGVLEGLTPRQRDAIADALRGSGSREHAVDLRWTINLVFDRFYVVLLAGRDLRRRQREATDRARSDTKKVARSLFLLAAFVLPALLVVAILLYGLKCFLGINLYESKHLMDFLQ